MVSLIYFKSLKKSLINQRGIYKTDAANKRKILAKNLTFMPG